jgi:pyrimidine operon attenuation protein/uracil phosphoribosyltransferase
VNLPSPEQLIDSLVEQLAPVTAPETRANLALVAMHTGGVWVMDALVQRLDLQDVPKGAIDTSFYRDDYAQRGLSSEVKQSRIPFEVEGRDILLIDDVLNTGRSVRAAINLLFDYGRPASIRLVVLVDRGGRELPLCVDFAGIRVDLPEVQRIDLQRDEEGNLTLAVLERQA